MEQLPEPTSPGHPESDEAPAWARERLAGLGIRETGEVGLRRLLETRAPAYTLYRLPPAATRKWKARYRIMLGAMYLDCQSVAEAYARAFLVIETGLDGPLVATP